MIAGQTNVANARTVFTTLVDGALQQDRNSGAWQSIARRYEGSGGRSIQITAVGATPDYEQWKGQKNYRGFRKLKVNCSFDKWHKSMELDRADVVNDQDGSTAVGLAAFARDVGYVYDKVAFAKIVTNPTVADGTALFATSHNFGTYNNKTTSALTFTTFDAGRVAMRNQTDEWGEYLNVMPDTLVVNPDEERIALEIAQADSRPVSIGTGSDIVGISGAGIGATQITNIFRGMVTVIVTPRWPAGDWMILDSRYPPIGLGVWRDPEVHIADDMSDSERMNRDVFLYSVEADLNAVGVTHQGVYGKLT